MKVRHSHLAALAAVALIVGGSMARGGAGTARSQATPVASPMTPPAATPPVSGVTAITMIGREMAFVPSTLTIPANTDVTVTFVNRGLLPHNLRIDALGIDVDVFRRQQRKVVINAPPGTYKYYCDIPGHEASGMWGTLTVT